MGHDSWALSNLLVSVANQQCRPFKSVSWIVGYDLCPRLQEVGGLIRYSGRNRSRRLSEEWGGKDGSAIGRGHAALRAIQGRIR